MKYCENCGEKLEDDAVYCIVCGHKQGDPIKMEPQVPLAAMPAQGQSYSQNKKKKYTKDDITDAIGCILIIAGFIALIILYSFFAEWVELIMPIIVTIIILSCIFRLLGAGIAELFQRRKDKKKKKAQMQS